MAGESWAVLAEVHQDTHRLTPGLVSHGQAGTWWGVNLCRSNRNQDKSVLLLSHHVVKSAQKPYQQEWSIFPAPPAQTHNSLYPHEQEAIVISMRF